MVPQHGNNRDGAAQCPLSVEPKPDTGWSAGGRPAGMIIVDRTRRPASMKLENVS